MFLPLGARNQEIMASETMQTGGSHPSFIPNDNLCNKCRRSVIWGALYSPSSFPVNHELYDVQYLSMSTRHICPFCELLSKVYNTWWARNRGSSRGYEIRLTAVVSGNLHRYLAFEILLENGGQSDRVGDVGIVLDGGDKGITGIIENQMDHHSLTDDGMYSPGFQRRISTLPTSTESINFIKKQIEHCRSHHEKCNGRHVSEKPTRLIDVGAESPLEPARLVKSIGSDDQYIALSHCWGIRMTTRLLKRTLPQMLNIIDVDSLPANFRDAIKITRLLGYRFLWIDSLCIIQDDVSDWGRESARMTSVYQNAVLTIGATRAADTHAGFLTERSPYLFEPILIGITNPGNVALRVVWEPLAQDRYGINNLASRAWCLQELLLSSRFLHVMKNEMLFECKTDLVWESGRVDMSSPQVMKPDDVIQHYMRKLAGDGHNYTNPFQSQFDVPLFGPRTQWEKIIMEYARRDLTNSTDKLVAVAGLARAMQPSDEVVYHAGLWQTELPQALLWSARETRDSRAELHVNESYRAPSWSWASMDGPVDYGSAYKFSYASEILHAHTQPSGQDYFGPVKAGYIIIEAEAVTIKTSQFHTNFDHDGETRLKIPLDYNKNRKMYINFDTKKVPNCSEVILLLVKARGRYANVSAISPRPDGLVIKRFRQGSRESLPSSTALLLNQGFECYSRVGTFKMPEIMDKFWLSWFPETQRQVFVII